MLKITRLTTENLSENCITDKMQPCFSFSLESDRSEVKLQSANISVNGWNATIFNKFGIQYAGQPLEPFKEYKVLVKAIDNYGEEAEASMTFETGRMQTDWQANWITDALYKFTEKKVSPKPMTFRKSIKLNDMKIKKAKLYATAIGIYEFEINGKKVGADYFAPGFTSYKNQLQYQTYDVTDMLSGNDTICAVVAGGWAVGKFTHCLRNRIFAKRQALLGELRIVYEDGTTQIIGTDESWDVSLKGKLISADFYDGEIYDATIELGEEDFHKAGLEKMKLNPQIIASYGLPVRAHEKMQATYIGESKNGANIYDFGQNFAGIIKAEIKGQKGQRIIIRHAEILHDGELFTKPLRTAKAEVNYICNENEIQHYSPRFTFMGFRYISIEGIKKDDIKISAVALYSDLESNGSFSCSNESLNKLQNNIVWSTKSNFIDIPTDCPQRDERMGWTGDIALFARTAAYNFDTSRFFDKWLKDLRSDQRNSGGVPVTIPHVVFPSNLESVFVMAIDHWGDSCILVPWAEYLARGDEKMLSVMYPSMKKYLKACKFWAGLFSVGKHRRIWKMGHHYGDWCAPGIGLFGWMGRGKWTATACFANSCRIVSKIARILGKNEDAAYYDKLSDEIADAYKKVFTDGKGKLKKEFQTAYVLSLYYQIFDGNEKKLAAENLAKLIRENNYNIGTGFPGTPYVLFALLDNGYVEDAFKMLLNDTCPSWLHEVKMGGTTIWERWDALRDDGSSNIGATDGTHGMVSFNHYANGAVGDFLYRRIAGIEAIDAGYKHFKIEPCFWGDITFAKGCVKSPYGNIVSDWKIETNLFEINIEVPVGTTCNLVLPNKNSKILESGKYNFSCSLN